MPESPIDRGWPYRRLDEWPRGCSLRSDARRERALLSASAEAGLLRWTSARWRSWLHDPRHVCSRATVCKWSSVENIGKLQCNVEAVHPKMLGSKWYLQEIRFHVGCSLSTSTVHACVLVACDADIITQILGKGRESWGLQKSQISYIQKSKIWWDFYILLNLKYMFLRRYFASLCMYNPCFYRKLGPEMYSFKCMNKLP